MNIHRVFFFCFLSALCDGNTGLVKAKVLVRTEGGSIAAACPFAFSGRRKFLCKGECRDEDVLVQTDGDRAQRGRYSIVYKEGTFPVSSSVVYVGITQLTKSDSGRYWCGLERPFFPDSYREFEIRVTDAPATFPETLKLPEQQQNEEITAAATAAHTVKGYVLPLVVSVTVVVLFAVVVYLLLNKWKKTRDGLNTKRQSRNRNMKFSTSENCAAGSECADSISPAVDASSRNQDKIYCNL